MEDIEYAKMLIKNNQLSEAMCILKKKLKLYPDNESIIFEIGKIYTIEKKYNKATYYLEQLMNSNEYKIYSEDLLLYAYNELKNTEKIFEIYKKIKEEKREVKEDKIEIVMNVLKDKQDKQTEQNKKTKQEKQQDKKDQQYVQIKKNCTENKTTENIENIYTQIYNGLLNLKNKLNYKVIAKEYIKILKMIEVHRKELIKFKLFDTLLKQTYDDIEKDICKFNSQNKVKAVDYIYKNLKNFIPKEEKKIRNILLNEYELSCRKTKLKSYPREVEFNITNKCNLKCIMCDPKSHIGTFISDDKSIDDLIEIIPYLQSLMLRGGEVFFHKRLNEILYQCKKNNVFVEIITNGLLLNRTNIANLLDIDTLMITFSIDSIEKEKYEFIRKGAKFERLIENINLFNEMRKKRNSKIKVGINMVVMSMNYNEIEKIIKFAGKNQFTNMQIIPVLDNYEYTLSSSQKELLKKKSDKLYELARKNNINFVNRVNDYRINEMSFKNKKVKKQNKIFCLKPFKRLLLDEIEIKPACHCSRWGKAKRNCLKSNGILRAWNNKTFQFYRECMLNHNEQKYCSAKCIQNSSLVS